MEDGWDLHALVRSCATSSTSCEAAGTAEKNVETAKDGGVRIDPLIQTPATPNAAFTPIISFDGGGAIREEPYAFGDYISFSVDPGDSQHVDVKKRKNKNKKVVVLRVDELNNDGWAWRKYGQKPIKGSPNPRNYYRCSTTKDCLARKQIERNTEDTSKFTVSYYGNHLHPRPTHLSSFVGTTISTRFGVSHAILPEQSPTSSSSPSSASSFSPTKSMKEDKTGINDQ